MEPPETAALYPSGIAGLAALILAAPNGAGKTAASGTIL